MNRPVTLVCHICGREFGTKSLAIHVKACEKKWENQENLKPPKQRRPCPQAPKGFNELVTKDKISREDINQFNAKSYDAFVEQALVQCEYCTRRFNPKSLIPHQKACKINPMIKKPYLNKGPLGKVEQQQPISSKPFMVKQDVAKYDNGNQNSNLVPCRRCGRTFLPDRVGKHERVCKADKIQVHKPQKYPEPKFEKPANKMKPNFQMGKKPKWKVQHQQFQNAIKVMKQMRAIQAKGGKLSDLPPPPRGNYDHYVECRYCGRKYAPDVAEKHIPKCANIINKPGGIKPSRIQQKYVGGTGSGANKSYGGQSAMYQKPALKPNMNITPTKIGSSNIYGGSSNSFGNASNSYGTSNMGYGQSIIKNGANQIGKSNIGSMNYNMGNVGKVQKSGVSSGITSSNMKPNLKSKSNTNKYW